MRISSTGTYASLARGLNTSLGRVQTFQEQLSSGKRINNYSDDPVGATSATRLASQVADWTTYQAAAGDATARLGAADSHLQSMSTLLRRVNDLTIASQSGGISADGLAANAAEVRSLRDELADLANTTHLGGSLFGGFAQTPLTRDAGGSWQFADGADGQIRRQIAPSVTVTANLNGASVFGFEAGKTDLFTALDNLASSIETGDVDGMRAVAVDVSARTTDVLGALGVVGATMNRVSSISESGRAQADALTAQRSQIEDTDIAQAVLELNAATASYQAALGAAARANLPSLASFLN